VIDRLRIAFPDLVDDLEFEPDGSPSVFPPDSRGPHDRIPLHLMADGLITGLLHLTAVAGAPANSMLAIDEMENQLHPHAIRSILRAMRERAAERNLTIVLTTHSPVLMNEFGDCPGQIFVLDYRNGSTPTKLDEIKSAEWLSLFSLGDLYDRMKFAAPAISIGSAEEV